MGRMGALLTAQSKTKPKPKPSPSRSTLTRRDRESAYVSVNGEMCWSKTNVVGTSGVQECGGVFKEERFEVAGCYATLDGDTPLTVRVWTDLDKNPRDESFAIDNVIIRATGKGA